jgi:hypothetical protein
MKTLNPLQVPRLGEIEAGGKFWGYLETEPFRTRYVLAAWFVRHAAHIVEIGGYRDNVITNFLSCPHESVTVYSLDAEFEPFEKDTLNGAPCRVRHVRDFFQRHPQPAERLAVVVLGLELHGEVEAFYDLVRQADRTVVDLAADHETSVNCLDGLLAHVDMRVGCRIDFDLSPNEGALREQLRETNMNAPFWRRRLYVLDTVR